MKKSKWLSWVIVCCMMISSSVFTASAETREVKAEDDYTLGEVRDILQEYLVTQGKELDVASPEYFEYVDIGVLGLQDISLKEHPDYDLIRSYASKFMFKYRVYQEEKNTMGWLDKDTINQMFNETLGEVRAEIAQSQIALQNKYNQLKKDISTFSTRISGYNASSAVAYARKWANSWNASYGMFSGDCTNFVSQCLVAGGIPMVVRPNYSSQPELSVDTNGSYWYNKNGGKWASASFIRIINFYPYWNTKVQTYSTQSKETMKSLVSPGDVVLMTHANDGSLYHAIFISYKSGNTVKFCGHTVSRLDYSVDNAELDDTKFNWKIIDFT